VTESGDGISHWVARAPAGTEVEWDARIINEEEGRLLAWESLPGSEVRNAGSVRFTSVEEGAATELKVALQYHPPGGKAGDAIARVFGASPDQELEKDLQRFKEVMEAVIMHQQG